MADNNKKDDGNEEQNYMSLGITYGLLAGSVGMTILSVFGQIKWGGAAIGACLFIGMMIGMNIKKK